VYEGEVALGDAWQPRFSLTKNTVRAIAVTREDLRSPQELFRGDIEGTGEITWSKMTSLNKGLEQFTTKAELVQWESFDGLKIQGFLYLPNDQGSKRFPLIVREHGGPSLAYGYKFEMEARYYASHGYATLLPNPRGSAGRGVRFLEMNRGNIEGDDYRDIMAGVDYCVSRGTADPKNLFVYGGSYGGYLVAWTVTHTDRFNAAVMDFGISNLLSCHGGEWNTYWEIFQFDIDPYKTRHLYEKKSPLYFVERARTPTLIIHGREDPCVPVAQSYEFFRALKELGVETELVVYPREGHGWMEKKHKIDAWQRHLAWFDGHRNGRSSQNRWSGSNLVEGEMKSKTLP
jgi:prolyl oligopeptidase